MSTTKIKNFYQADFLIKSGCKVIGCGNNGRLFIEFLEDETFSTYMQEWKERPIRFIKEC